MWCACSPFLRVHAATNVASAVWTPNSAEALGAALADAGDTLAEAPPVRLWSMSSVVNIAAAETHGIVVPWRPIGASEVASLVADAEAEAAQRKRTSAAGTSGLATPPRSSAPPASG